MRKYITILSCMILTILSICTTVYAASVPPQTFPGNDSNPNDYTPPEGCIHYEIPNSDMEGTHTVTFNETGAVDPDGAYSFTVVVGTEEGEDFTKVLSWSSNFPIYAVIVKGGDEFNLYQYDTSVRGDTDLVSPDTPSGDPADVSHVSVVICPEDFPPIPPTPTPCPPCPPCPPCFFCFFGFFIIFIILIFVFFLLGLLSCKNEDPCCRKHESHKKHSDQIDIDIDINKEHSVIKNYNCKDDCKDHCKDDCKDPCKDDCKDPCKDDPCGHDKPKDCLPKYPKRDYFK